MMGSLYLPDCIHHDYTVIFSSNLQVFYLKILITTIEGIVFCCVAWATDKNPSLQPLGLSQSSVDPTW